MVIKWTAEIPEGRDTSTMSQRSPSVEDHLPLEPGDSGPNSYPSSALSTASARESIYNYERDYGRTYHSFRRGKYCMPNDEGELDRMDIHYHTMRLIMKGRHWLAPIQFPRMILDVGAGTGIWGMDVADDHEEAQVIGIDLSPTQPTSVSNWQSNRCFPSPFLTCIGGILKDAALEGDASSLRSRIRLRIFVIPYIVRADIFDHRYLQTVNSK